MTAIPDWGNTVPVHVTAYDAFLPLGEVTRVGASCPDWLTAHKRIVQRQISDSAGLRSAFSACPSGLGSPRPTLLGCRAEPVFGTLWRDPTDCFSEISPAGTLSSGLHRGLLTQAIRRPSQKISELNEGERLLATIRETRCSFEPAFLQQGLDDRFRVR